MKSASNLGLREIIFFFKLPNRKKKENGLRKLAVIGEDFLIRDDPLH
jgi:hypothetical protein